MDYHADDDDEWMELRPHSKHHGHRKSFRVHKHRDMPNPGVHLRGDGDGHLPLSRSREHLDGDRTSRRMFPRQSRATAPSDLRSGPDDAIHAGLSDA